MVFAQLSLRLVVVVSIAATFVASCVTVLPAQAIAEVLDCNSGVDQSVITEDIIVSAVCPDSPAVGGVVSISDTNEIAGLPVFGDLYYFTNGCDFCAPTFTAQSGSTAAQTVLVSELIFSEVDQEDVTIELTRTIQNSWISWALDVKKSDGSPGTLDISIHGIADLQNSFSNVAVSGSAIMTMVSQPLSAPWIPSLVFKSSTGFTTGSFNFYTGALNSGDGDLQLNFGEVSSARLDLGVMPYNSCAIVGNDGLYSVPGQSITLDIDPDCTPSTDPVPGPDLSSADRTDYLCTGPMGAGVSSDVVTLSTEYVSHNLCSTSPEIQNSVLSNGDGLTTSEANSTFGVIYTKDGSGNISEVIAGEPESTNDPTDITIVATHVYSAVVENWVDVRVQRLVSNSWVTWNITSVYSSDAVADPDTQIQPSGLAAIELFMAGLVSYEPGMSFVAQGDNQIHTVQHASTDIPQQVWLSGDGREIGFSQPLPNDAPGGVEFSFGAVEEFSFSNGFYYPGICGDMSFLADLTDEDIGNDYSSDRDMGDFYSELSEIFVDANSERSMSVGTCSFSPDVDDVSLWNSNDAFDGVGAMWVPDPMGGKHYIYDPSVTTESGDGWMLQVFRETDIETIDGDGNPMWINLVVNVLFQDSWITWHVNAYDSLTNEPADITLTIEGNLGSDHSTNVDDFSYDSFITTNDGYEWDPALLWHSDQMDEFLQTNPDDPDAVDTVSVSFVRSSDITLNIGLLDLGPGNPDNDELPYASPEEIESVLSRIDDNFDLGLWTFEALPALSLVFSTAENFEAGSTLFEGVEQLRGYVEDVTLANTVDAFDGFGSVFTTNSSGDFVNEIVGDEWSSDSTSITYTAHNIYSEQEQDYVDVTVTRNFSQNWVTWDVSAVFSQDAQLNNPGEPAEIDISISGNLGSDDFTTWEQDAESQRWNSNDGFISDPVLLWIPRGAQSSIEHADGVDDTSVTFEPAPAVSLWLGLVDYESFTDSHNDSWVNVCNLQDTIEQLSYLANAGVFMGIDPVASAGNCGVPTISSDVMSLTEGDVATIHVALPEGSACDVDHLDECPTAALYDNNSNLIMSGPLLDFEGMRISWEDYGDAHAMKSIQLNVFSEPVDLSTAPSPVVVSIQRIFFHASQVDPVPLSVVLSAQIGDPFFGSQATISVPNLASNSSWVLDVNSVTQTLNYVPWSIGGTVNTTVTIPNGLPAGWHHFSFRGLDSSNNPVFATFWFEVDASGMLLGTSATDPSQNPPGNNLSGGGSSNSGGSTGGFSNGSSSGNSVSSASPQGTLVTESSLASTSAHINLDGVQLVWLFCAGILLKLMSLRKKRKAQA